MNFILATAGHVDHGKSALVKALTGTDPDRLPEEKARGITIDLGFAHLELVTLDPQPLTFSLGIVDVPGHEDFVKNMVAGVGSIDLALLVVAADDGWMPQTEEHVQILTYLDVRRAVVALTKVDLAERDETVAISALRERLAGTAFAAAPIVPTSVVTRRGVGELKATLARVLADTPPPRDIGKPRLPMDRVFTLRGIGTVVTGTLTGGVLQRDQTVVIQPSGQTMRVRSLQSYNRDVEWIGPGMRAALNLPGAVPVDKGLAARDAIGLRRGGVITLSELGAPTDTLNVELAKSARLVGSKTPAARPLKDGMLVRVHLGCGHYPARVVLLDGRELQPGQRALAQLRFDSPVFAFTTDRFIVRDWPEQATLAGGIILDADASRKTFRTETERGFLAERAKDPLDLECLVATVLRRDHLLRQSQLLLKSRFSQSAIVEAASRLQTRAQAQAVGQWLAHPTWWQQLRAKAVAAIDADHQTHPERLGPPLNQLRVLLEPELPEGGVFDVLVQELCQSGFVQTGADLRRVTHRPALPAPLQPVGASIRALLAAKGFEPPSRRELAPDLASQHALRFLLQTGEATQISDEVVLLTETLHRIKGIVVKHIQDRGPATVSELRQVLHTTRRVLVPLLEHLDRQGVTHRDGDRRRLGRTIAPATSPVTDSTNPPPTPPTQGP
jgi:selenocysteine-specific elongation factor